MTLHATQSVDARVDARVFGMLCLCKSCTVSEYPWIWIKICGKSISIVYVLISVSIPVVYVLVSVSILVMNVSVGKSVPEKSVDTDLPQVQVQIRKFVSTDYPCICLNGGEQTNNRGHTQL